MTDPLPFDELPITFDCEGAQLLGMLHLPRQIRGRGMLSIVAGGPQYRGGVGRMQVQMARALAAAGVPVMRFDYRGLGDSEGKFNGFTGVTADIGAAIAAFCQHAPGLREMVLWGGCDAASATLINAWRFPEVTGIVVGNPWVHSEHTGDLAAVKHFRKRLRDKDFWLKVLRLRYNPVPALGSLARAASRKLTGGLRPVSSAAQNDDPSLPFQERMRIGLARFKGDVLMLMSGRSLASKEFDELVAAHPAWQQAMRSPRLLVRHDIAEADQAFSGVDVRAEVVDATRRWMLDPRAPLHTAATPAP